MGQSRPAGKAKDPIDDEEPTEVAPDTKLYEELGELARFIDTTMKTLSEFSAPVSASSQQLPQAIAPPPIRAIRTFKSGITLPLPHP